MHAGIERRAVEIPRIPLDLWVRLSHEDYAEPFDADGVDLSEGGLALRSDYLPEVGDRLSCRFDHPTDGSEVAVDGEVVWAHDAGERSGEFGLRFANLDLQAESSLREIVKQLAPEKSASVRARLHLEGVATPIDADVTDRSDAWLTAEQSLPFLRLGMSVAVEGMGGPPGGRLASVDLRIEDGTPRLVLGVELDSADAEDDLGEGSELEARATPPDTLDEPIEAAAGAEAGYDPADATIQDLVFGEITPSVGREAQEARVFRVEPGESADARDAITPGDLHAPDQERATFEAEESLDDDAREEAGERAPFVEMGAQGRAAMLLQRARPYLDKARVSMVAAGAKVRPALGVLWTKIAAAAAWLVSKGGPATKALALKLRALGGKLLGKVTARKAKRRTTAAPPKRIAQSPRRRRQQAEAEAPAPRKTGRRVIVLSVLAFAGVGAAVYAFSGGEEAPEAASTLPVAAPVVSTPTPAQPAAAAAAPDIEQGATPVEAVEAQDPSALPSPETTAGRLGEPTFPSLRDAQGRPDGPVSEGSSFGADEVEGGRSATIRMSQPVNTLRGQRQDGGFTVTIPGSLALDRAGPVAAANPSIERATILNRGDHAVLTVRFVAGRDPAYRVAARGAAIEITVGR